MQQGVPHHVPQGSGAGPPGSARRLLYYIICYYTILYYTILIIITIIITTVIITTVLMTIIMITLVIVCDLFKSNNNINATTCYDIL